MTRQDAEEKIAKKVREIRKIMETYNPTWSGYLCASIVNGKFEIDWYNDADRLFMVKELGWACLETSFECESCVAKQYCSHTMNSDEEVEL